MRKLMKSGSVQAPTIAQKPQINESTATIAAEPKLSYRKKAESKQQMNDEDKKALPVSVPMTFEEIKSKEIISHLKTVLLVSLICLLMVGGLYFLEQKIHWVNDINLNIKGLIGGWDWKL